MYVRVGICMSKGKYAVKGESYIADRVGTSIGSGSGTILSLLLSSHYINANLIKINTLCLVCIFYWPLATLQRFKYNLLEFSTCVNESLTEIGPISPFEVAGSEIPSHSVVYYYIISTRANLS